MKITNQKPLIMNELTKGIKTRYDDIIDEIRLEKAKKYFEQNNTSVDNHDVYCLGSICGAVLNKII